MAKILDFVYALKYEIAPHSLVSMTATRIPMTTMMMMMIIMSMRMTTTIKDYVKGPKKLYISKTALFRHSK